MDSADLEQRGLGRWLRFNPDSEGAVLATLPTTPGVFAVRRERPYARVHGQSDIVYVGVGANRNGLKTRVQQCYHPGPTQATNQRILEAISGPDEYELSWVECQDKADAEDLDEEILLTYLKEHGELPPLRRRV